MNAVNPITFDNRRPLDEAIEAACRAIAPNWPLDRFIAVNPWWGWVDRPFGQAGRDLARLTGSRPWLPPGYYRAAWQGGEIRREHLLQALREANAGIDEAAALRVLEQDDDTLPPPLPLLSDVLDAGRDLRHEPAWRDTITHQVSQFCAAWFDRDQADWHPGGNDGLYAAWRQAMIHDHSVALLMHAPEIRRRAATLPSTPEATIEHIAERIGADADCLTEWLQTVLFRINGWAAWCAWLRWEAGLRGEDDDRIVQLLAIRAAWESLLDDGNRGDGSVWVRWRRQWDSARQAHRTAPPSAMAVWQRAQEIAWQHDLIGQLTLPAPEPPIEPPSVQAMFCIDVRSEVFRRALEAVAPDIRTLGFAGFFGLPLQYTPLGTPATRPQLPGLLAPVLDATDSSGDAEADARLQRVRERRLGLRDTWQRFQRLPASGFTLVESLGLGYLGKIVGRSLKKRPAGPYPDAPHRHGCTAAEVRGLHPYLVVEGDGAIERRAELAAQVLQAMSLTAGFARLVLLAGHGSQSANNPHAAGLDCGACCGQTGEINARVLAGLLNDRGVRRALSGKGIDIPESTHFLAGMHNTTTDEFVLFDTDQLPDSHAGDLARLQHRLDEAGQRARAERAPALGLAHLMSEPGELCRAIRSRAEDWCQTRPEWGLANNAAFIVAPRSRSRHVNLEGRSFLHEYDWRQDREGKVLELIMTAPMIVTHWINMQYYASTVDNLHFGSGNKVLHNVVGGRIGVFEGNNGDLRIGLPMQSLHDGERWMHAPLRLSVFIDAPRSMIEAVIDNHELVRQLLDNQWLYLFRFDGNAIEQYWCGEWRAEPATAATGSRRTAVPRQ